MINVPCFRIFLQEIQKIFQNKLRKLQLATKAVNLNHQVIVIIHDVNFVIFTAICSHIIHWGMNNILMSSKNSILLRCWVKILKPFVKSISSCFLSPNLVHQMLTRITWLKIFHCNYTHFNSIQPWLHLDYQCLLLCNL